MASSERPTIRVEAAALRQLMDDLFAACGCPEDLRAVAVDVHLEAELRGIGLQGIDYVPYLIANLRSRNIDPSGRPLCVRERPASALIDGGGGLGQPAAVLAADLACQKAREVGSAAVGVTNSQDIFMIGYYAERMARSGCVGMVCTSGPPLVHPHGGVDPILSTNPLAFGIPTGGEHPIIVDLATSALSNARVRQAAYHGEQIPPGTGVGPDGSPTTDAATIRKGALSPMAEHRGFALGLVVALFSGPLTGSDVGLALAGALTGETSGRQGHFFFAVDPECFGTTEHFEAAVRACLAEIKGSRKAAGTDRIRIPGERALAERQRRLADGVPVLLATWEIVGGLARELGVELPVPMD